MRKKVLRATLAALLGMILLVCVLASWSVYLASRKEAQVSNLASARAIKTLLEAGESENTLGAYSLAGARVTLIDADGTVIADSKADPASMENHAQREEFIEARSTGTGEATRRSATMGEEYLYSAIKLSDGRVIRVAKPQRTVTGLLISMIWALLLSAIASAVLAILIARFTANSITKPLEKLDLENPEDNTCYEELSPLLRRLGKQQRELTARLKAEEQRARQIEAVTSSMNEGLVLLDADWRVLTTNASARRYLEIGDASVSAHLLELNRSSELRALVELAKAGQQAFGVLHAPLAVLEAHMSPVTGEASLGFVLLLTDVTARQEAERARREFSANVSHEMMTPLTSISGYAELIESGMAQPEDVKGFAERILSESRRMTALIEDVMRLSRLDEGSVREKWEDVDLYELANDVSDALCEKAKGMKVAIAVRGREASVRAVRQLVWEILYNLTDNAVKYNIPGGSVTIDVDADGFTVSDTGIGIAKDQQNKVFERFYRVDKSHSRRIGGTGLGLSIVRHAAEYLGAGVSLESHEDAGTKVSVVFSEM